MPQRQPGTPRQVDPSEFADAPPVGPQQQATGTSPRQVDPSEFADASQATGQEPGLLTKIGQVISKPMVDIFPGFRQGAESVSTGPGMNRSPLEAQLRGFATGAMETPLSLGHLAAALSLGSGAPAVAANATLAAQGLGEATDPTQSTLSRVGGGLNALLGGVGAAASLPKAVKTLSGVGRAAKAVEPIQEVKYGEPMAFGSPVKQGVTDAVQQLRQGEQELPESWKPFVTKTNEARADAASMGHPAEPITPEAQAQGAAPIAPAEEQPGSSLAKFFKTPGGAAGANYGAAQKAAEAGEIPSADAARAGRLLTIPGREAEGQQILSQLGPQPTPAPTTGGVPPPDYPAAMTPEAKQSLLQQLLSEGGLGGSKGAISSQALTRLLGTGTGAAIGAPIGAQYDEDDPTLGGLKGAIAGGLIGGWIAPTEGGGMREAVNNFLNTRNASMLAGVSPVLKKILADPGAQVNEALLKLLTPGERQIGMNLLKEHPFLHPLQSLKDLKEGALSDSENLGAGIGGVTEGIRQAQQGPLGLAGVPFKAIMNMAVKSMVRSGLSEEEAMQAIGSGKLETDTMEKFKQWAQTPLGRFLIPFSKITSSMGEGARNIPGISLMAGNPATKWQRGAVGGLNMALGGANELYSQQAEEEGDPLSPLTQGAMAASVGPKWVAPYAAGKALMSMATQSPATALTEWMRLIPGSTALMPTRHAGETTDDYAVRVLTNIAGNFVPTMFTSGSGSTR